MRDLVTLFSCPDIQQEDLIENIDIQITHYLLYSTKYHVKFLPEIEALLYTSAIKICSIRHPCSQELC